MPNNLVIAVKSDAAVAGLRKYDTATDKSGGKTKQFGKSVNKLEKQLGSTGSAAGGAGRLIGGMFAGFTAFTAIRSAITTMAQFEETMAVVRGVTGASSKEFKKLEQVAKDLGSTTRFTATQAGEGLLFLARAGFTTEEAITAIPDTLKFAQSSMLALGSAADIVSNILTQFGLAAEETARAGNVLVNTANSANTNVQQLAEAMKFAGPIAGALGISIEEAAASIGVLGDSGIQASLAGTGLRQVMLGLTSPTSAAKETIVALGLELKDLDPTSNSLVEIFTRLRDANLGVASASTIFGRRAAATAIQLSRNVGRVKELTEANENAIGTIDRMAALMDDTLKGAFLSLGSAVQAVSIQMGDKGILGALKSLTQSSADAIRILIGLRDQVEGNVEAAERLAFAIEAIGGAITSLVAIKAAQWFMKLGLAIKGSAVVATLMTKRVLVMSTALKTTTISTGLLGKATRALRLLWQGHPILLIATGLAIGITALISFNRKLKESEEKASKLATTFAKLFPKRERTILGMSQLETDFDKSVSGKNLSGQIEALKEQNKLREQEINQYEALKKARQDARLLTRVPQMTKELRQQRETERMVEQVLESFQMTEPLPRGSQASTITPKGPSLVPTVKDQAKFYVEKMRFVDVDKQRAKIAENLLAIGKLEVEQIEKELAAREKIDLATKKANKSLDKQVEGLEFERSLIGLTNVEREIAIELQKAKNIADKGGIALSIERRIELTRQVKEIAAAEELVDIGQRVGDSFSSAFLDMATGAESASQAIKNLTQAIARLVLEKMVADPLATAVAGFATNLAGSIFNAPVGLSGNLRSGVGDASGLNSRDSVGFGQNNFGGFSPTNAGFNTSTNIYNNTSTPMVASNISTEFNGREYITSIVVDDINNRGPISNSIGARS